MSEQNDGGPAFPPLTGPGNIAYTYGGMTLRDYFAAHCQEDDRLVKVVRAMDDRDLAMFALHPDLERDEWLTETDFSGMPEVEKVAKRLRLEAKAIARVRYMQADAMLAEREDIHHD